MESRPSNKGYCVICEGESVFIEHADWLRDSYACNQCGSIPRQRALVNVLNLYADDWKRKVIHESSPGGVSSDYIRKKCNVYTESQFFQDIKHGDYCNGVRCENLESMTFDDDTFDIFITQDVFEHVLRPELAFKEINRVLKPNGVHIFTMPWYTDLQKTEPRVKVVNEEIEYIKKAEYHGNPIDDKGSLVTVDWGMDFPSLVNEYSKMRTIVHHKKDRDMGLDGEFLHVFVSYNNKIDFYIEKLFKRKWA